MSKFKQYSKELTAAIQIAKKAGKIISKKYSQPLVLKSKKETSSFVSTADVEIEKLIQTFFKKKFPTYGFIGEESREKIGSSPLTWVVDPIDGTTNFAKKIPIFAVSIALVQGNEPVVGIVLDPLRNELFYAVKNQGSFLNGKKLDVTQVDDLNCFIGTLTYRSDFLARFFGETASALLKHGYRFRLPGSAALEMCYVACARIDFYCNQGLNSWDLSAALLVMQEANVQVLNDQKKLFNLSNDFIFATIHAKHLFILDKILQYKQNKPVYS